MLRYAYSFGFEIPDSWSDEQHNNKLIAHGPRSEEIIASGRNIVGSSPSTDEISAVRHRLLNSYISIIESSAAHLDLVTIQELNTFANEQNVVCHTIFAVTAQRDWLFCQAVFEASDAVLLCTMEAPNDEQSTAIFKELIQSVRMISSS